MVKWLGMGKQRTDDRERKTGSKTPARFESRSESGGENRSGKISLQSSDIDPLFCFLNSVFYPVFCAKLVSL